MERSDEEIFRREAEEMHTIRDQLLRLQGEGDLLHAQALEAQARGERDIVIALTEAHIDLNHEVRVLMDRVQAILTRQIGRKQQSRKRSGNGTG